MQNGLECNSHYLLHCGWRGLWLEGNRESCDQIGNKFRPVIKTGRLNVVNAFITRDNIDKLITENRNTQDSDSVPDLSWKQAYNAKHTWDKTDWQGASLKAFELLGRKKGYVLVGTNLTGANVFIFSDLSCIL